ncbi:hypothetical protein IPM62_01510 [Candidatus Woesebacteria bacterium]|nr:MAG: hypothetical protein IPM62_01510 [Candidatus Woesebacteria bacterium]
MKDRIQRVVDIETGKLQANSRKPGGKKDRKIAIKAAELMLENPDMTPEIALNKLDPESARLLGELREKEI